MTTKIQDWQMDGKNTRPFAYTVLSEVRAAIIKNLQWVESGTQHDVEYWKRYLVYVTKSGSTNFTDWGTSPDEEFNKLWVAKYQALIQLYESIHVLHIYHGFEPYQSSIYAEKFDQAVDFLTDIDTDGKFDPQNYPMLEHEARFKTLSYEDVALSIVRKRGIWINQMASIEHIRMEYKSTILESSTVARVSKTIEVALQKLSELDQKWI